MSKHKFHQELKHIDTYLLKCSNSGMDNNSRHRNGMLPLKLLVVRTNMVKNSYTQIIIDSRRDVNLEIGNSTRNRDRIRMRKGTQSRMLP